MADTFKALSEVPAGPTAPHPGLLRPLIVSIRNPAPDEPIEVSLDLDGWVVHGNADRAVHGNADRAVHGNAGAGEDPVVAAAARAALAALAGLLPTGTKLHLDWIEVLPGTAHRPPAVVTLIGCVTPDGEDQLLGSALIRTEPSVAAVRATLDALNRRLARLARMT